VIRPPYGARRFGPLPSRECARTRRNRGSHKGASHGVVHGAEARSRGLRRGEGFDPREVAVQQGRSSPGRAATAIAVPLRRGSGFPAASRATARGGSARGRRGHRARWRREGRREDRRLGLPSVEICGRFGPPFGYFFPQALVHINPYEMSS